MTMYISRRDFLRSAGGITFLALTPAGPGLFAAPAVETGPALPFFTVLPYIQPGANSRLQDGHESMIVAWQTLAHHGSFSLDFGPTPGYGSVVTAMAAARPVGRGGDVEKRFKATAEARGLPLCPQYFHRVRG